MDAYFNGFPLVLDSNYIKAELKNIKSITNQSNVSIAQESQTGFTHFGSNSSYVDFPSAITVGADICVFTIEIPEGGMYQFAMWDGAKICFRTAWGNRTTLQNSDWHEIAFK